VLKKILVVVLVLVAAFLGFVATRPSAFHIERSASIAAPPAVVFPFVNNHKNFILWSPWEKRDPNQKTTFSGPPEGVGAEYHWAGNDDVGEGNMKILESKPNELVKEDLTFIKPFEAKNTITYTLVPDGAGTKITWGMDGENGFAGKMFGVFMDMDKMLGKDFDDGLAALKTLAEAKAKEAPAPAPAPVGDAPPAPTGDAAAPVDGGPAPTPTGDAGAAAPVPPPVPTPPG
jgi:hypothetical protein